MTNDLSARLMVPWRPSFTANAARRMTSFEYARVVREWREAGSVCAFEQRLPRFDGPVVITVEPRVKSRRGLQDVAGCAPAAKAVIDGLVDARVLPGDAPDVVREIRFLAPVIGDDALVVVIEVLEPEPEVA